jgi:hypothetical protein
MTPHLIADDLRCGLELIPHELDSHQRLAEPGEPAFMTFLVDRLVVQVESFLARHAAFEQWLADNDPEAAA